VENQQLSPAEKTPEQIQDEMAATRESLTGKVAALENQVVGTVQTAANTLTGTVDAVKSLISHAPSAVGDSVKQAASAVSEKVKEAFDLTGHVRARPWTSVGVSAGGGFLTGLLLFRERTPSLAAAYHAAPPSPPVTPVSATPGVFDELFKMLGQKVRGLAETAINSASEALNRTVRDTVPKHVDAAAARLMPEPQGEHYTADSSRRRANAV